MDLKVSDRASQLAKEWIKTMSGGHEIDSEDMDELDPKIDGRPARLGLGAEYASHTQLVATLNPLEKKLKAKLGVSTMATNDKRVQPSKTNPPIPKAITGKGPKEDIELEDEGGRACQFSRKQTLSTLDALVMEPAKRKKKRKTSG
ncbi:hypothetical protein KP509_03G006100 [Ceratopteris richardii]|uniref:Uncharacterized protein n=1 Tax=Ceratopteris richardii TaxID=49495 RepID=A0A8T2UWU0_CERRI|nr:hypothetical protein KP509_03G006100 [Ceratopteris richardii]